MLQHLIYNVLGSQLLVVDVICMRMINFIALFTPHDSGLELPKILMLIPEFHTLCLGREGAILGRPMMQALAHHLCFQDTPASSWSRKVTRSQGNYKITNELISCYIVCLCMNSLLLWDFVRLATLYRVLL